MFPASFQKNETLVMENYCPCIVASFSHPLRLRLFPAFHTVGDEEEIKEKAVSRGSNKEALLVDETGEGNEYLVFERYKSGFENFICALIGILGRIPGFGTSFKAFL